MVGIAAAIVLATAGTVEAAVTEAVTLDGPSADVLDIGGAAMADDGTGGIVYRRRVGGRARVFVVQLRGGRWLQPQQIDTGQQFDSSWPRIAASSGGRLLVTWVHRIGRNSRGFVDGMFAAWKAPGSRRFTAPTPVDQNLGEATSTHPSLAMAANGGSAFLTYVVTRSSDAATGRVDAEYRLLQFRGGLRWSRMPSPRRSTRLVRAVTAETAPKVVADAVGNGVIAYLEPDDADIDRVYARRIFAGDISLVPLLASPAELDGQPVTGPADQFAVGVGGFGEAVVAVRQQPDAAGGTAPRLVANLLPPVFAERASAFLGATEIDVPEGGTPAGLAAGMVAEGGAARVAYGVGGISVLGGGGIEGLRTLGRFGTPGNAASGEPRLVVGPKGSGVLARRLAVGGQGGVEVRELTVDGTNRRAQVAATAAGLVGDLELGGSGLGDAIVALRAGSTTRGELAAALVDAPPLTFAATAPTGWVRPSQARISWEPARNAIGAVRYQLLLDGVPAAEPQRFRGRLIPRAGLDQGRHTIQVRATDERGQAVLSNAQALRIDGTAPVARVRVRPGRRVQVRVTDNGRSGLDTERSTIRWGDGDDNAAAATISHTYKTAGPRTLTLTLRDRAGNRATTKVKVTVR